MEDLSARELIAGLSNKGFEQYKGVIMELLINKLAENENEFTKEECFKLFSNSIVEAIETSRASVRNIALILMSNSTLTIENSELFMDFLCDDINWNGKFFDMINNFVCHEPQCEPLVNAEEEWSTDDSFQHVGSVLCNLCQTERGRKFILNQKQPIFAKLHLQLKSRNPVRRRGAVATIRSCLFDKDIHWWFVNEAKGLNSILLPLVVPNPFNEKDKLGMDPTLWLQAELPNAKQEKELDIMKMLLECVVLLCQTRAMRETLRKLKVYPIIRNLDLTLEENDTTGCSEALYEIVNFLMGDEEPTHDLQAIKDATEQSSDV